MLFRSAAGGGAGEDPAGEEQGAGDLPQAPPGHNRGPGPGDRGQYFSILIYFNYGSAPGVYIINMSGNTM